MDNPETAGTSPHTLWIRIYRTVQTQRQALEPHLHTHQRVSLSKNMFLIGLLRWSRNRYIARAAAR